MGRGETAIELEGQLRMTPEDWVGGAVAVDLALRLSNEAALVVRHVSAFPDGFTMVVGLRLREVPKNWPTPFEDFMGLGAPTKRASTPRFALAFADGTRLGPGHPSDRDAVQLHGGHGSTGGEPPRAYFQADLWCPRLPVRGHVRVHFDWPGRGFDPVEATIDGVQLRAAAKRARPLWPRED